MFPGNILDYRHVPGVLDIRNDLATLGTQKSKAVEIVKTRQTGTYGYDLFGRRQDTFVIKTLAGYKVKDINDEQAGQFKVQEQIAEAAVRQATKPTRALQVDIRPDVWEPFDFWDIEDTVTVEIKSGRTNIETPYRIVGYRALMDGIGYRGSLILVPPIT